MGRKKAKANSIPATTTSGQVEDGGLVEGAVATSQTDRMTAPENKLDRVVNLVDLTRGCSDRKMPEISPQYRWHNSGMLYHGPKITVQQLQGINTSLMQDAVEMSFATAKRAHSIGLHEI